MTEYDGIIRAWSMPGKTNEFFFKDKYLAKTGRKTGGERVMTG